MKDEILIGIQNQKNKDKSSPGKLLLQTNVFFSEGPNK